MQCKFEVGQKVVCLGDRPFVHDDGEEAAKCPSPKEGDILTIRKVKPHPVLKDIIGLAFLELPASEMFDSRGFRPLEEKKTDISIFQKILEDQTKKVGQKA